MPEDKFPKLIDYAALKQQFGEDEQSCSRTEQIYSETTSALHFASNSAPNINKQYPAYTDAIDDQEYIEFVSCAWACRECRHSQTRSTIPWHWHITSAFHVSAATAN